MEKRWKPFVELLLQKYSEVINALTGLHTSLLTGTNSLLEEGRKELDNEEETQLNNGSAFTAIREHLTCLKVSTLECLRFLVVHVITCTCNCPCVNGAFPYYTV